MTKVTLKTSRKGNEFTIVELEDFTGKTEIALFGMNHNQHKDKFRIGEPTFVKINIVPGRFNPERTDMQIEEVSSLESKRGNIANGVLVYMNFKYDNREFFTALEQIPDNNRKGDLYFDIFDPESRQSIRVHSRKKMPITRELIDTLRDYGMRFKISTL